MKTYSIKDAAGVEVGVLKAPLVIEVGVPTPTEAATSWVTTTHHKIRRVRASGQRLGNETFKACDGEVSSYAYIPRQPTGYSWIDFELSSTRLGVLTLQGPPGGPPSDLFDFLVLVSDGQGFPLSNDLQTSQKAAAIRLHYTGFGGSPILIDTWGAKYLRIMTADANQPLAIAQVVIQ